MENNINQAQIRVDKITEQTKVCECCGRDLPLSEYHKSGKGYRKVCKICEKVEAGASEAFKGYTSRELIDELIRRGYRGKLEKVVKQEYTL